MTEDLIAVLAGALERTTRELNALADLTESTQDTAGRLVAYSRSGVYPDRAADEAQHRLDELAAWQMSDERIRGVSQRARAKAALERMTA